jgi:hypothetical protein
MTLLKHLQKRLLSHFYLRGFLLSFCVAFYILDSNLQVVKIWGASGVSLANITVSHSTDGGDRNKGWVSSLVQVSLCVLKFCYQQYAAGESIDSTLQSEWWVY